MATTSSLRSRRSAAQLHALTGVEREIRANDPNGQRKYLKDYNQAFLSYESVLDDQSLKVQLKSADIVLVGDYHALPASQQYAASLLEQRALDGGRPVVLGMETIFARDQHILDEWWRREIDESELRERIRFDLDWGYDWQPFYDLLVTAREHAEGIYGLDCMPREDLRKIGARDRHAAHKIAEIRQWHPRAVILVTFGESHLAPGHLPQRLHEQLADDRILTVLQNVDALYWQAAGENQAHVNAVKVSESVVCVFNSTPLEKYENYRLHLSRWGRTEEEGPDPTPTIYNLIDSLLRFLEINRYSTHNGTQPKFLVDLMPEVYGRNSEARLSRLLLKNGLTAEGLDSLLRTVEERGCIYLPAVNAFYVREFQMAYAAEEAARFLHYACRGALPAKGETSGSAKDRFHAKMLESAMGYLGSRIIYPARVVPEDHGHLDLSHAALERYFEQSSHMATAECRNFARRIGYVLGNSAYESYLAGSLSKMSLKQLFLCRLEEPGAAREICLSLVSRKQTEFKKARAAGVGA
jgi:Haem-binding uptake, Tiki superfamily, ChaN